MVSKKEKFLKKHPPLSDEQVKQKLKEAEKSKHKYVVDMQEIEKNLLGYSQKLVPIVDPETDKILAWMRCPLNEELETYFGMYGKTSEELEKLSREEQLEVSRRQYEVMAGLIENPKHDSE